MSSGSSVVARALLVVSCLAACGIGDGDAGAPPDEVGEPAAAPGAPRSVAASSDRPDVVRVTWLAPEGAAPDGYVVVRDGTPLVTLDAGARSFDDASATPYTVAVPRNVGATDGTWSKGVRLTWSPSPDEPRNTHAYSVIATCGPERISSAPPAVGRRAGPAPTYEVQIGGGGWIDAGAAFAYEDRDAPLGTLTATAQAYAHPAVTAVILGATAQTGAAAAAVTYRVRARSGASVSDPTPPVTGRRALGRAVKTQWQRSTGDADSGYVDLPNVTGLAWHDDTGPLDGSGRWYRAVLRTDGAVGISPGVRATNMGYAEVAAAGASTCALRATDRSLTCWGRYTLDHAAGAPYEKIFGDSDHVCVLRAVDHRPECFSLSSSTFPEPPPIAFASLDLRGECGSALDGSTVCWGSTPSPSPDARFVTIAPFVGSGGCGLRASDRKPECWGTITDAAWTPPDAALEDLVFFHGGMCGRRVSDHVVTCWGPAQPGGVPTDPMSDLRAPDGDWACGIRASDAKAVCWPRPPSGAWLADPPAEALSKFESDVHGAVCGIDKIDGRRHCWAYFEPFTLEAGGKLAFDRSHGCVLRSDGRLRCKGVDDHGEASSLPPNEPFTRIVANSPAVTVVRASDTNLSFLSSAWVPPQAKALGAVGALAAGLSSTCATRASDQRLACWGKISLDLTSEAFSFVSIADGSGVAVRKSDGALVAFPAAAMPGQPAGSFTAVATSGKHACAIRASDKKVACWGENGAGQAPPGPSADAYEEIATADLFTCGVRAGDRSLVCWGSMPTTKLVTPTPFGVHGLTARGLSVVALRDEDDVAIWDDLGEPLLSASVRSELLYTKFCGVRYDGHPACY